MPLRSRRGDRVRAGVRGPDDPPNKKTDPPQHIKKRAPKRGGGAAASRRGDDRSALPQEVRSDIKGYIHIHFMTSTTAVTE
eukprot:COSAG01_NODE_8913_length_2616_cov_1.720699_1_plen_80_part_10